MKIATAHLTAPWRHHAATRPDAIALIECDSDCQTTWAELAQMMLAWKQQALAAGVGPGDRVVIRFSAGRDWIALVWACWEIGAVWCPVLPDAPPDRATRQIEHADPRWVVGATETAVRRPVQPPCEPLAAYLIYTSGSTGDPKGVLVGHEGLPTLWAAQGEAFQIAPSAVVGWMLSPAFDASVSDVGVALTAGARLVIVPKNRWRSYRRWMSDMADWGITHLDAPPSWLGLWAGKPLPPSLRTLVAGGEVTSSSVLDAWAPELHWVNVYGPTEATVCTSLERRVPIKGEAWTPTLGQPLPRVMYRVQLPGALAPVEPEPQEGELWIGGPAVALEYWRDPERTADRFATVQGVRWFRTGDAVRRLDRSWLFLGRLDRQIKRRGQLINLDEVEAVLTAAAHGNPIIVFVDSHTRLVAACFPDTIPPEAQIWAESLPRWGHPQAWFVPSEWPTGSTGKVDRRALAQAWEQR